MAMRVKKKNFSSKIRTRYPVLDALLHAVSYFESLRWSESRAAAPKNRNHDLVQSLKGRKRKNLANLEKGVKICIQGQFFMLNKTGRDTRLIF